MLSGKTNTVDTYSIVDVTQTRNSGEHVKVYGVIDDTEACGAMDTLPFEPYTWNFDIGGGRFDAASEHLLKFYKVKSLVYDPYNRSPEHNRKVLAEIKEHPADTVTSNSVLNVILKESDRQEHIQLAYRSLRKGGTAFFKVWRGDSSGVPSLTQNNKEALHYFGEVADVFGDKNVCLAQDDCGNTLLARKV